YEQVLLALQMRVFRSNPHGFTPYEALFWSKRSCSVDFSSLAASVCTVSGTTGRTGWPRAAAVGTKLRVLHSRTFSSPAAAAVTRSFAPFTYFGSISAPAPRRPFRTAAAIVDPTPAYGSNTQSPGRLIERINLSTSSIGNWQGCPVFST